PDPESLRAARLDLHERSHAAYGEVKMDLRTWILGRLSLEAIPYHEPILVATFIGVAVTGLAVLALMTRYRLWGPLWRDWIVSIDHKKIGIMYMVLGVVMLLRGFARSEEHTSELQS